MRQMKDVNLVDFVELRLKSKEDFCFRHNASNRYAGLFEVLCSFPTWKLDYPALYRTDCLRSLTKVLPQKLHKDFHFNNLSLLPYCNFYGSFILCPSGPEFEPSIMHWTTARFLFPKCKLAKHPKPWRITMMLETVYMWRLVLHKRQC